MAPLQSGSLVAESPGGRRGGNRCKLISEKKGEGGEGIADTFQTLGISISLRKRVTEALSASDQQGQTVPSAAEQKPGLHAADESPPKRKWPLNNHTKTITQSVSRRVLCVFLFMRKRGGGKRLLFSFRDGRAHF